MRTTVRSAARKRARTFLPKSEQVVGEHEADGADDQHQVNRGGPTS